VLWLRFCYLTVTDWSLIDSDITTSDLEQVFIIPAVVQYAIGHLKCGRQIFIFWPYFFLSTFIYLSISSPPVYVKFSNTVVAMPSLLCDATTVCTGVMKAIISCYLNSVAVTLHLCILVVKLPMATISSVSKTREHAADVLDCVKDCH